MTIISRLGYCPDCAKEKIPKTGQSFLVMGSKSGKLKALIAVRNGRAGFVPFTYRLKKVKENEVFYQRICGMCGCGVVTSKEEEKTFLSFNDEKWSGWIRTSLSNWNSLVMFKDTGFEI